MKSMNGETLGSRKTTMDDDKMAMLRGKGPRPVAKPLGEQGKVKRERPGETERSQIPNGGGGHGAMQSRQT